MAGSPKGPLDGVLENIIAGLKKDKAVTEEDIRAAWRRAAGRKAACHTRPVAIRRAELVVNVDDSGWLYELTLKKKDILKKLSVKLKKKKIRNVRFRIGDV
ncbi:MAG: DciA family protein [Candidatus Omnitrophota bacterium]